MQGVATQASKRRRPAAWAVAILVIVAAGLIAIAGEAGPDQATAQGAQRPNVVVVMTDDQTAEELRVMDQTVTRLGRRGTTFDSSFVNWPACCPSRATFLTGQYAHNHGVLGNRAPQGGFTAFDDRSSIATWLQRAGYRTAFTGKYLNGYGRERPRYVPPGWSDWYAAGADGGNAQRVYNYTLNENRQLVDYGERPRDFKQDVLTRHAVDFLRRQAPKPRPFFLFVSYTAPHSGGPSPNPNPPRNCERRAKPAPRHAHAFDDEPLPRPPNFNEADVSDKPADIRRLSRLRRRDRAAIRRTYRCQLESLLSVDEGVRDIARTLIQHDEMSNTYLIFTSDNGWFNGEHRIPKSKGRLYEEAIRVPLLIRGPGFPRGAEVATPVINADLAPTIADVTGVEPGLAVDGRSLLPLAQNPGQGHGRGLLIENAQRDFVAIRTSRYIYGLHGTGEEELYDMRADPFQLISLHDDPAFAEVKAALAARLAELRECSGPSCREG